MQNVPAPEALGGQDPPCEALTLPSRTAPCFCVVNCPIKSQPRKTWAPSSTPQWQSPEYLFSLPLSLSFPPSSLPRKPPNPHCVASGVRRPLQDLQVINLVPQSSPRAFAAVSCSHRDSTEPGPHDVGRGGEVSVGLATAKSGLGDGPSLEHHR